MALQAFHSKNGYVVILDVYPDIGTLDTAQFSFVFNRRTLNCWVVESLIECARHLSALAASLDTTSLGSSPGPVRMRGLIVDRLDPVAVVDYQHLEDALALHLLDYGVLKRNAVRDATIVEREGRTSRDAARREIMRIPFFMRASDKLLFGEDPIHALNAAFSYSWKLQLSRLTQLKDPVRMAMYRAYLADNVIPQQMRSGVWQINKYLRASIYRVLDNIRTAADSMNRDKAGSGAHLLWVVNNIIPAFNRSALRDLQDLCLRDRVNYLNESYLDAFTTSFIQRWATDNLSMKDLVLPLDSAEYQNPKVTPLDPVYRQSQPGTNPSMTDSYQSPAFVNQEIIAPIT